VRIRASYSLIVAVLLGASLMTVSSPAEETEILKITVGASTTLSPVTKENCSSLAVSRTGAVAAFYPPRPSTRPEVYRVSSDGGLTWGEELRSPGIFGGGVCGTALRQEDVISKVKHRILPLGWFYERNISA